MNNLTKTIGTLFFTFIAAGAHAKPGNFEISCGDIQNKSGASVVFVVSPLTSVLAYSGFQDDKKVLGKAFVPTSGIYDKASLTFSAGKYSDDIKIHGAYKQVTRVNNYRSVNIGFTKNDADGSYSLTTFSEGSLTNTDYENNNPAIEEKSNAEYLNLKCSIAD